MEATIDETTSQLPATVTAQPVQLAEPKAPTIEMILQTAVERNVDPAALEKLVDLHERIQDRNAESAFNAAFARFKLSCPPILKATKGHLATYAALPDIQRIIDPILCDNGLAYRWDTEADTATCAVTCHLCHVQGHATASHFKAPVAGGNKAQSGAQAVASVETFAKRRSLCAILGLRLVDELDDDAAPPMPQPDADPNAPRILPRDERTKTEKIAQTGTAAILNGMVADWQKKNPGKAFADFLAFAQAALKTDMDLSHPKVWTPDAIEVVRQAIREAK